MTPAFSHWDWLSLALHFMSLSLMAVGGGITVVPEMHRFLVIQQGWLTGDQLASSIALAQVAPGPNVLFVALVGWNVGLNAGGLYWALFGALLCLLSMVLPSSLLTLLATRWTRRNQQHRGVRAFMQGMTPLVIALLFSTAWLLAAPNLAGGSAWPLWALGFAALLVLWKTRIHLIWVLAVGALLGATGLV